MKNFKLLLVAFIALSLFACNKKSRLTENMGLDQGQTQSPQTVLTAAEFLSNISGIWLVNTEPVELSDNGTDIANLDLTNHKQALPLKIEFKDSTLVLTSFDENTKNISPFQIVNIENNRAYFHTEIDYLSGNEPLAKNFKKYYGIIDVALDVSESIPFYHLSYNLEYSFNNDYSTPHFMKITTKVMLTKKIGSLEDKLADIMPYYSITEASLANKEFELKLSKPGQEVGQEIVTKMFIQIGNKEKFFPTNIRDFSSETYNNTLYGKNILYASRLVLSDMKPKFEFDMDLITDDSRYEFLGYYFLEDGKIIIRGQYRIQNIKIKEWNRTERSFDSSVIGGDWEIDSFEPVREEGHFEAVEVIPAPTPAEEHKE